MQNYQISWFQKTSSILGILGPVINAIVFTILGFIYPGYNPMTQAISELGTSEAPHNIIMNIFGFNLFGLYLIFFGIGFHLGVKKHTLTSISMILFILSGICIFTLAWFPCDPGCISISIAGKGHGILISIASVAIPTAIVLSLYPLWKDNNWRSYWWFFFLQIGIFLVIYIPIAIYGDLTLVGGLIQRLGLSVPISWILIMSIRQYRLVN